MIAPQDYRFDPPEFITPTGDEELILHASNCVNCLEATEGFVALHGVMAMFLQRDWIDMLRCVHEERGSASTDLLTVIGLILSALLLAGIAALPSLVMLTELARVLGGM